MDTRVLGKSGLTVSRIGLGLAALGRPGYINLGHREDLRGDYDVAAMRNHSALVLDAAWEAGVRYVDTARSYGLAEEFLAGWLTSRNILDAQITVGSKWGYTYTADWKVEADVHEVKDHTLPTLLRQEQESLALLGDWLDLYQIHSATASSGVLDRGDVLDELARLKADHNLAIGLTLSGQDSRATLLRAMEIERDGQSLFDTVQATWNILEPSLTSALQSAHDTGMGVIVKEALANGRLTSRNSDPAMAASHSALRLQADRLNCTVDQLALAAVLDQRWADCVLSGAATPDHLRSNLGALSVTLDSEAREAISSLAEPIDTYWRTRSEMAWG
jgi:aryl-alcohol dehydrogenase-like predicted oxidoreductase